MSPGPTDRRAAVLRMLEESPEGLTDAALARRLGEGVRPQTVNQLCRRLAAEGALERVGTRPIGNRLPAPPARKRRSRKKAPPAEPGPRTVVSVGGDAAGNDAPPAGTTAPEPARSVAVEEETHAGDAPGPHDAAPTVEPGTEDRPDASPACGPPPYDALQAWSRVTNVQSLVAGWLVGRGATLRWAPVDGDGPARDLVATLDGDDVHVEVTGWPADGARTHPTTIAGDWFSAAEHAAVQRRRAHPRARIVIALPDTRRYRSLAEQRAAALDGAGAEVWFVDAAGAVHAR